MIWRPDRLEITYEVNDVVIEETKFISTNDVLVSMITTDKPVSLLFEGQSFFIEGGRLVRLLLSRTRISNAEQLPIEAGRLSSLL